nr:peptidylprolyl isomerase [Bacteroidota bacterium]
MKKTLILLLTLALTTSLLAQKRAQVLIQTEVGDIVVELYNETPKHRDNFIRLAKNGFYNGTLFHRVIPNFMIQGGDPDSKKASAGQPLGNGGPGYKIPAEFVKTLFHKKGVLAAAREPDAVNPKKASSGSQFYIVQGQVFDEKTLKSFGKPFGKDAINAYSTIGGSTHLDGEYTVFGEVVRGLELVEKNANA